MEISNHFTVGTDFSIPLGIETDLEKSGGESDNKYFIKLLAGDNMKDIQDEIVEPEGFILDYLMKGGYFNYDHNKGSEFLIGEPTDYELVKNTETGYCGLLVKGFLYKTKEKPCAESLIKHLKVLKAVGSKRHIGASVEGKTLERNGNKIVKAFVKNIAITEHPINRNTWVDIVKSFAGVCQANSEISCSQGCPNYASCFNQMDKAMETGQAIMPASGAGTLRKQSIDRQLKVTTFTDKEIAKGSVEFLKLLDGSTYINDITGKICTHQSNKPTLDLKKLKKHLKECRGASDKIVTEIIKMLSNDKQRQRINTLYTILT